MNRTKYQARCSDGPYSCYFNCGNVLRTKFDSQAIAGWIWLTGYGDKTVHFCPSCRRTHRAEIEELQVKSNTKPEGYPQVRVKL